LCGGDACVGSGVTLWASGGAGVYARGASVSAGMAEEEIVMMGEGGPAGVRLETGTIGERGHRPLSALLRLDVTAMGASLSWWGRGGM
jgi:hypothetical protein